MDIKLKLRKHLPIFVILFVSASAFLAGFIQNEISSNGTSLSQTKNELELQLSRMENTANTMFINEIINDNLAYSYFVDAVYLDTELDILWDNITWDERAVLSVKILRALLTYKEHQLTLEAVKMYVHFQTTSDDYIIASKEVDGYDYKITKSSFDSNRPVRNSTAFELFGWFNNYSNLNTTSVEFFIELRTELKGYSSFTLKDVLFTPLDDLQAEINSLSIEIDSFKQLTERIGLGVSITTVAVILSTAMANRINEKKTEHELSVIQSNVTDGKIEIVSESDKISIPALLIAAVLSSLGILIPLIL